MNEFLNPKSMLTPGIAGSLSMAIANSLSFSFAIPPQYSALVLSYLFAALAFAAAAAVRSFWQRMLFFLLNGLVIFSVAAGANAAGNAGTKALGGGQEETVEIAAPVSQPDSPRMKLSSLPVELSESAQRAVIDLINRATPGRYTLQREGPRYRALRGPDISASYLVAPRGYETNDMVHVTVVENRSFFKEWF